MAKPPVQPLGYYVNAPILLARPSTETYDGKFASLTPIYAGNDVDELFECSHGSELNEQVWTYLPYGPFNSKSAMFDKYLTWCQKSRDPLFFSVTNKETGKKCGVTTFMNIVPENLSIEIGHIWFSPQVQRTKLTTEALYLMMCECFDRMGYRRLEWQCHALNAKSRAAAQRLGFSFEGIFYKFSIMKGRNRDNARFAILDDDWKKMKGNFEKYLYGDEEGFSLKEANRGLLRKVDPGEAAE